MKKEPSFLDIFNTVNADIFAVQETKLQEDQAQKLKLDELMDGYTATWSFAERKGYSGTAVFSKEAPLNTIHQIGSPAADDEGRICALEFDNFWFVDVYTPNAKNGLTRIDERQVWDKYYTDFLLELNRTKPVVTCGDFNVAHHEIDLKNPKANVGNAGFSDEERADFTALLDAGFTDTFRALYPTQAEAYSWWSYKTRARERNAGWRIDYFLVSNSLGEKIKEAAILNDVYGSDHCPVSLTIEL